MVEKDRKKMMLPGWMSSHFHEWKWWYFVLFLVVASVVSNSLREAFWRKRSPRGRIESVFLRLPERAACPLRDVVHLDWAWSERSQANLALSSTQNWQYINVSGKRVLWLMDTPIWATERHYTSYCVLVTRGAHGTVVMYPEIMHPVVKVPRGADYRVVILSPTRTSVVRLLLRPNAGPSATSASRPHTDRPQ